MGGEEDDRQKASAVPGSMASVSGIGDAVPANRMKHQHAPDVVRIGTEIVPKSLTWQEGRLASQRTP